MNLVLDKGKTMRYFNGILFSFEVFLKSKHLGLD